MFGLSNKEKYQHYLDWFEDQVKDRANWAMLRDDKDCANYMKLNETPIPYDFGEAMFRMGDPKKMAKAIEKYQTRTKAKIEESYKYVGGNRENGLINDQYVKNDKALQEYRKSLKKYSGDDNYVSDELFRIAKQAEDNGENVTEAIQKETNKMNGKDVNVLPEEKVQAPSGEWVELSAWQAFKHWMAGGSVEQQSKDGGFSVAEMTKGKK